MIKAGFLTQLRASQEQREYFYSLNLLHRQAQYYNQMCLLTAHKNVKVN